MKRNCLFKTIYRVLIPSVFILLLISGCSEDLPFNINKTDHSASESFDFDVGIELQSGFRLNAINGAIDVTGSTGVTVVEVWGEKIVRSESTEDAEEHLENLDVRITKNQSEIYVETIQPRNTFGRSYEVEYHVLIPEHWKVNVVNVNGEVDVYSIENDVTVKLTNGDIKIENIAGSISADLTNGNTHLLNTLGNVDIEVTNGSITSTMILPEQGSCRMSTVNGQISLSLPDNTSADFYAHVTNGFINISGFVLTNWQMTQNTATCTLADGNGSIRLDVTNGQINVNGF